MKITLPRNFLATAADRTRPTLSGALIDAKNRTIVITNGRALNAIPIPGKTKIAPAFITPEIWKAAKGGNLRKKVPMILDTEKGTLNGHQLPAGPDGNYPNWKQVIPLHPTHARVCINPQLLADLVSSFGTGEKDFPSTILLEVGASELDPVRVICGNHQGVLMPARDTCHSRTKDEPKPKPKRERSRKSDPPAKPESQVTPPETPAAPPAPAPKTPAAPPAETAKVGLTTNPPTLSRNEEKNGIELRFDGKPMPEIRKAMKDHGFRWGPNLPGEPWYAPYTEDRLVFASQLAEAKPEESQPDPEPAEKETPTPAKKRRMPDFL